MGTSSPKISVAYAQKCAHESLTGFPPRLTESYLAFAAQGDAANLDAAVLGVLNFYLATKPNVSIEQLPGTTRLIEDLGCDSLTMMDTVFMVETLFDIKLADADLTNIATLDDLRTLLRKHVHAEAKSTA